MAGNSTTDLDLDQQRTLGQILGTAGRLYGRQAPLLLVLAGIVVVPYEVVVVLLEKGKGGIAAGDELLLALVGLALIYPCIAATQVQVLLDVRGGKQPRLGSVIRRGVAALPVVAAADIIAGIGIFVGIIFFLIPGLLLAVRWAVVAPTAAVERTDWPTALRRSGQLTRRNRWRVFGLLVVIFSLSDAVALVAGTGGQIGLKVVAVALSVIVDSFGVLLLNILYFDLRAREAGSVQARPVA